MIVVYKVYIQKYQLHVFKAILVFLPIIFLIGYQNSSKNLKEIEKNNDIIQTLENSTEISNVQVYGKVIDIQEKEKSFMFQLKVINEYYKEKNDVIYGKYTKKKEKEVIYIIGYIDKEVYAKDKNNVNIGDIVKCKGNISTFKKATGIGQFDEYEYYVKQKNISGKQYIEKIQVLKKDKSIENCVYDLKNKFKNVLCESFGKKDSGIVIAMILGDKNNVDDETNELYKKNNISHIICISGLHINIMAMGLYKLLKRLKINIYVNLTISIIVTLFYGIMVGNSVATVRAVIMFIVSLVAVFLGRTYDSMSALALSALIILIKNPNMLYSCSMLISFSAVIGILLGKQWIKKIELEKGRIGFFVDKLTGEVIDDRFIFGLVDFINKARRFIKEAFIMSLSVNIATLPIILYFYYEISLISLVLNIIVIPLMTLIVSISLIICILGLINLNISKFLAGSVHYILKFYKILCKIGMNIKYNRILSGAPYLSLIIIFYCVLIICVTILKNKKYKVCIIAISVIIMCFGTKCINNIFQKDDVEVTMLDIGQGDAIYIRLQNNISMMIDGGSTSEKEVAKYKIEPFLKYKAIDELNYVIITHSDEDHISGIREMIVDKNVKIKNLILPYINNKEDNYIELESIAKGANIKISYIRKGDILNVVNSECTLKCLHPAEDFEASSVNGYSTVMQLIYKDFDMLFVGDLEADGEQILKDEIYSRKIEVLKVAHHGSKNSSTEEFLEKVNPKYALISAGKNNRYGHPHDETLQRLKDINAKIFVTSKVGTITLVTDGNNIDVK